MINDPAGGLGIRVFAIALHCLGGAVQAEAGVT